MIEYRTLVKRYLELWFDEPEPQGRRHDVVVRYRAPEPSPAGRNEDFHSLQIDLSQSLDDIFLGFARNTRAQIRKSLEGDALQFEFIENPSVEQLQGFIDFYNVFARGKGVDVLRRPQLEAYGRSGRFSLNRVFNSGRTLAWHSTLRWGGFVGLVHSASHFRACDDELRKLIGRANRRLHWEEFQHFRTKGFRVYDFGGWYTGSTEVQKLMINRFKEGFGGKKVRQYTVTEHRSLFAKSLAALNDLWSFVCEGTGKRQTPARVASPASR